MPNEIILDENGKITPESGLFKQLDKWHEDDEYSKIVEAVLSVPLENRSNKLWFRLISAYNNMEQFGKAREELEKIAPHCDNPADLARLHYMNGYIFYREDREYLAILEYRRGLEADPEGTSGIDLKKEIADCRKYITENLEKLRSLSERVYNDVKEKCKEKSEKTELSDEEFAMYLGFLPALRVIPGHSNSIGFGYSRKYDGEEKQTALDWLSRSFGITDRESLLDFCQNAPYCNINATAEEIKACLAEAQNPDPRDEGQYVVDCFAEFIGAFKDFLPEAGVLAWDISEKTGFIRWAYACGIIPDDEFNGYMKSLSDLAREKFASFEEYILSAAFGAALFMFKIERMHILHAIDFLARTVPQLKSELPELEWLP